MQSARRSPATKPIVQDNGQYKFAKGKLASDLSKAVWIDVLDSSPRFEFDYSTSVIIQCTNFTPHFGRVGVLQLTLSGLNVSGH